MTDINTLPEFPGFTVYDAETGEPVENDKVAVSVGMHQVLADEFVLSESGYLYIISTTGGWYSIPKQGKYIIQLGTGECYRW